MAIVYARNESQQRITVQISGYVETRQVVEVIERQGAEGTWGYALMYDVRGTSWLPTGDDLEILSAAVRCEVARRGPRGPVVIVVASPRALETAREYGRRVGPAARTEAFLDYAKASAWLDQTLLSRSPSGLSTQGRSEAAGCRGAAADGADQPTVARPRPARRREKPALG